MDCFLLVEGGGDNAIMPDLPRPPLLRSFWRELRSGPSRSLIAAGFDGEVLLSGVRVVVIFALLVFPLVRVLGQPYDPGAWYRLGIATVALVYAVVVFVLCRRGRCGETFGYVTSALDVTLVTALLVTYLLTGSPARAARSDVLYSLYLLAIAATGLRYNVRICALGGLLAASQYAGVLWLADRLWRPGPDWAPPQPAGAVDWRMESARIGLLVVATVLSVASVLRARELRREAILDRLTGLFNRAYFDEALAEAIDRRDGSAPLSVALIDLDDFKACNDSYGHRAGDALLREVAGVLRSHFRETDVVARYGGEEFGIVMPRTSLSIAMSRVEEMRELISRQRLRPAGHDVEVSLTVSVGVASWPEDGEEISEVVSRADDRLYRAKHLGKDRVEGRAAEPPRPPVAIRPPRRLGRPA